jgi:hypothetical protein
MYSGRVARDNNVRGNISGDDSTRANDAPSTDREPRQNDGSGTNERGVLHDDTPTKSCSRRHVDTVTDDALVIDASVRIDDGAISKFSICPNRSAHQQLTAWTERCRFRYERRRVNRARGHESRRFEFLEHLQTKGSTVPANSDEKLTTLGTPLGFPRLES